MKRTHPLLEHAEAQALLDAIWDAVHPPSTHPDAVDWDRTTVQKVVELMSKAGFTIEDPGFV